MSEGRRSKVEGQRSKVEGRRSKVLMSKVKGQECLPTLDFTTLDLMTLDNKEKNGLSIDS